VVGYPAMPAIWCQQCCPSQFSQCDALPEAVGLFDCGPQWHALTAAVFLTAAQQPLGHDVRIVVVLGNEWLTDAED
jgi:hypothetical protein